MFIIILQKWQLDIIEQLAACSELVTAIREPAAFADVYYK
jgi:hypothetical protein